MQNMTKKTERVRELLNDQKSRAKTRTENVFTIFFNSVFFF